jgi:hypothetical protein
MAEMGHQLACSGRGYLVRSCQRKRTLPRPCRGPPALGRLARGGPMSAYRYQ